MSNLTIPKTMRAVAQNESAKDFVLQGPPFSDPEDPRMRASVQEVPVPQLEDNDVLIKVYYAAQNPTDWKHSAGLSPAKAIIGCDLSGEIVKLGDNVVNKSLKVGDKVAGTVHGGLFTNKGAYAEYARAQSDLIWKVPEGLSMDEASTFGVAWVTALQALVSSQKKEFPPTSQNGKWILIYGASSSVGLFAVPLAKAMGYKVLAVCGSHNHDLVKSYGADQVIDYKNKEKCVDEIKRITNGGVTLALDTISEGDSWKIALDGFSSVGGQLNMILPPPEEAKTYRKEVTVTNTLMYTLFGNEFNLAPVAPKPVTVPSVPADRDFHVQLCERTPELITKYGVKGNPVKLRGGLDDILAGWEDMKAGKVSGSKLVYKVAA